MSKSTWCAQPSASQAGQGADIHYSGDEGGHILSFLPGSWSLGSSQTLTVLEHFTWPDGVCEDCVMAWGQGPRNGFHCLDSTRWGNLTCSACVPWGRAARDGGRNLEDSIS